MTLSGNQEFSFKTYLATKSLVNEKIGCREYRGGVELGAAHGTSPSDIEPMGRSWKVAKAGCRTNAMLALLRRTLGGCTKRTGAPLLENFAPQNVAAKSTTRLPTSRIRRVAAESAGSKGIRSANRWVEPTDCQDRSRGQEAGQ
jgi:hypothetical protein